MSGDDVEISVVVPVYRSEASLEPLYERLRATLSGLTPLWQIIFVEDRGPDGSWAVLERLAKADPRVTALRLSRNFGQHAAITAGFTRSVGRWTVVMDCDLQDPPEVISRLYAAAQSGHDIVFARRAHRTHSRLRRLVAKGYFALLRATTGASIDERYGSFSMVSRKVVDAYLRFKDRDRHYLFILYWLGFTTAAIDYAQGERASGKSAYSLKQLLAHAFAGVFFQTTAILRWIVYLGFAISASGFLLATYFLYRYAVYGVKQEGWISLAVLVLVLSGTIITTTGVAGLYTGKMFEQAKERPLFVVDLAINDDARN
jgi:dolichol-phosphate mannosyltransferase